MNSSEPTNINNRSLSSYFNPFHSEEKTSAKPSTFFGKTVATTPTLSWGLRKMYNSLNGAGSKVWTGCGSFVNYLSGGATPPFSADLEEAQQALSKQKALGNHELAELHAKRMEALSKNNQPAAEALKLIAEAKEKLLVADKSPKQELELLILKAKLSLLAKRDYFRSDDGNSLTHYVSIKKEELQSVIPVRELKQNELDTLAAAKGVYEADLLTRGIIRGSSENLAALQ